MKIVIHVGMHKTGSTAIQEYFLRNHFQGVSYTPWTGSNLCGLFILLFQDEILLHQYHGFRAQGPEFLAQLSEMRHLWLDKIVRFLEQSGDQTVIFSAEDISWPGFSSATAKMADFFRRFTDQIQVVGYVREPRSFAVSAFQQYLKDGGLKGLDVEKLWPHYRGRFERLDDLFGRENVVLKRYDRDALVGHGVVSDFASLIGVSGPSGVDIDANASLSAEATALLFVQRRFGDGFVSGFSEAQARNNQFIEALSRVGNRKFDFSEELWGPVQDKYASDYAWICSRLGGGFSSDSESERVKITSENDFVDLAAESFPLLKRVILESLENLTGSCADQTARAVDMLRKIYF